MYCQYIIADFRQQQTYPLSNRELQCEILSAYILQRAALLMAIRSVTPQVNCVAGNASEFMESACESRWASEHLSLNMHVHNSPLPLEILRKSISVV